MNQKARIIQVPNTLAAKVVARDGKGLTAEAALARAEANLAKSADAYASQSNTLIDKIRGQLPKLMAAAAKNKTEAIDKILGHMHSPAYEIETTAGTFGFPLLTTVASYLCSFINDHQEPEEPLPTPRLVEAIAVHVEALSLISAKGLREASTPDLDALLKGLARIHLKYRIRRVGDVPSV